MFLTKPFYVPGNYGRVDGVEFSARHDGDSTFYRQTWFREVVETGVWLCFHRLIHFYGKNDRLVLDSVNVFRMNPVTLDSELLHTFEYDAHAEWRKRQAAEN